MANVMAVVWLLIGWISAHTAALIWTALMLPGPVERARRRIETRPVVSFFLGLGVAFVTIVVVASMVREGQQGGLQLLGWAMAGPMLAAGVVGGAGLAQILAERIQRRQQNNSAMLALVGGSLCTTLPALLPIIGWFVYFPITFLMAIGAGVNAILSFRKARQPREDYRPPVAVSGEAT
jgi:hypothetical protein